MEDTLTKPLSTADYYLLNGVFPTYFLDIDVTKDNTTVYFRFNDVEPAIRVYHNSAQHTYDKKIYRILVVSPNGRVIMSKTVPNFDNNWMLREMYTMSTQGPRFGQLHEFVAKTKGKYVIKYWMSSPQSAQPYEVTLSTDKKDSINKGTVANRLWYNDGPKYGNIKGK